MLCLACGDCCARFSPLTEDETIECPHLRRKGDVAYCAIYPCHPAARDIRPKQCRDHDYPSSVCPVGRDVLGIHDANALAARECALTALLPVGSRRDIREGAEEVRGG